MEWIQVEGGVPLRGEVTVQGAKNSVLPILAATILTGGICEIENCPHLSDVDCAMEILRQHQGDLHAIFVPPGGRARLDPMRCTGGNDAPDALIGDLFGRDPLAAGGGGDVLSRRVRAGRAPH